MTSLILTLLRLLRAIRGAWALPDFRNVLLLVALTLTSGTIFFRKVEGWSWVDAFYFSATTIATVGYGDLAPRTDFGKLFTVLYIVVGVGLFITLVTFLSRGLVSGDRDGDTAESPGPRRRSRREAIKK
jgi:voltage-gated potassium channel